MTPLPASVAAHVWHTTDSYRRRPARLPAFLMGCAVGALAMAGIVWGVML